VKDEKKGRKCINTSPFKNHLAYQDIFVQVNFFMQFSVIRRRKGLKVGDLPTVHNFFEIGQRFITSEWALNNSAFLNLLLYDLDFWQILSPSEDPFALISTLQFFPMPYKTWQYSCCQRNWAFPLNFPPSQSIKTSCWAPLKDVSYKQAAPQ